MPLPRNEQILDTAGKLVNGLRGAFGTPESKRPAHAKGRLVKGTFVPTAEASSLSKAKHFNDASTPIIVRFSNSTGLFKIPDTDGQANPRGIAIRFVLGDNGHRHTDIIAHSTAFFPTSTGEGFLALLGALGDGSIGKFLEENPAAAAFVNDPKPSPSSFVSLNYFGVNAFKLVAENGRETFVRYRVVPEEYSVLSESELASKSDSYLTEELAERLSKGPATLKLVIQIAEEGDVIDDATKHWPGERKVIELGTIKLEELEAEDQSKVEEKQIIFDPVPRVDGVEPSDDPLIDMRAAIYLLSGRGRRAARLEE